MSVLNRRTPTRGAITGVILAGGLARRMGGRDKGLVPFDGRPLVAWIIDALAPQVGPLLINANRSAQAYGAFGYPVIGDAMPGFAGPLAGLAAGLEAASTPWVLTVPCDGPFLAPDLAERLGSALLGGDAELAVAHDGHRIQPVYALIPRTLAQSLRGFLAAGERKTGRWVSSHRLALADFSDCPECFANVNSEADLAQLERSRNG